MTTGRLLRARSGGVVGLLLLSLFAVAPPVSNAAPLEECTVDDFTAERPILNSIEIYFLFGVASLNSAQESKCAGQRLVVCLSGIDATPLESREAPIAHAAQTPTGCNTTEVPSRDSQYLSSPFRGCYVGEWRTVARWEHDLDGWKYGGVTEIHAVGDECLSGEPDYEEPIQLDLEQFILQYRASMPAEEDQIPADFKWDETSPAKIAGIIAAMKKANSGTTDARIEADQELESLGYELTFTTDTVTGRNHLVFYEPDPTSESALGWGLYVLRYDTSSAQTNLAVEVPHPTTDDPGTADLGSKMYVDLDAKMYAMAGTNRYNSTVRRTGSDGTVYENSRVSDMARSYESLFHKVHTNFTNGHRNSSYYDGKAEDQKPLWSPTHVIQVHGYEPRPGRERYPEVILSNGSCQPHAKLELFASRLTSRNISAGVFRGDAVCSPGSKNYPDLGATINPQGKHTRKKGGYFYHVEASQPLRDNLARYRLVTKALGETLLFEEPGHSAKFGPPQGFDPFATAAYARRFALSYNPNYYDWNHRGAALGGDSTNFASQALEAGGWQWYQPVGGAADHRNSEYWFFRGDPATGVNVGETAWSWVNAESWNSFAKKSGRVEKIKYLSDVGLGDIIQMSMPDSKNKEYRSMVVTALSSRGPLVSYHSPNRVDEPLWDIVKSYNLAWQDADANAPHPPGQSFSAWRTISVSNHAHRLDGVSLPGVPTTQARHELDAFVPTPESTTAFDRSKFKYPIATTDNCDTRTTVLIRDGRQVQADAQCRVLSGIWYSEYDGVEHSNPGALQIDHVVSLSEAWRSGAEHWSNEQREVFANDVAGPQLRAVTGAVNASKGARDPEQWRPPLQASHCDYAKHWIRTKTRWGLTMQQGEIDALQDMLTLCPD